MTDERRLLVLVLAVGSLIGFGVGVMWAFDFDGAQLRQGLGRVALATLAGLVIAALFCYWLDQRGCGR